MSDLANHLSTLSAIVGRVQTLLDRRDKNQALKVLAVVPSADDERMLTVIGLAGVSASCAGWLDTTEILANPVSSDASLAAAFVEMDAEEELRKVRESEAKAERVRERLRTRSLLLSDLADVQKELASYGVVIDNKDPIGVAHYEALKAYLSKHAPQLLDTIKDPRIEEPQRY